MDPVTETFDLFETHVPNGHEALMVLKAHLLVEMRLRNFIEARISDSTLLKHVFDRNSPVRNGKGLTLLARSLAAHDEIRLDKVQWEAIDILNSLRNDLAHNLEPNSDSVLQKMKNFIEAMGEKLDSAESVDQHFHSSAIRLVGHLGIHRDPIKTSDFAII